MLTKEEIAERNRARARKYYYENREKRIAAATAWGKANPEKKKEIQKKSDKKYAEKRAPVRKAWWENNPDKRAEYKANTDKEADRERSKRWRQENPETRSESVRKYKAANADSVKHYNKKYAKENPDVFLNAAHRRRARKLGSGGILSLDIRKILHSEQNGKCCYCFCKIEICGSHLDHFIPLALGGMNDDSNVVLACASCNLEKNAKHPLDFMRAKGLVK